MCEVFMGALTALEPPRMDTLLCPVYMAWIPSVYQQAGCPLAELEFCVA